MDVPQPKGESNMLSKSVFAIVFAVWFSCISMQAFHFVQGNFAGIPIAIQDDLFMGHYASHASITPWESLYPGLFIR
jgi:hypothetical protein